MSIVRLIQKYTAILPTQFADDSTSPDLSHQMVTCPINTCPINTCPIDACPINTCPINTCHLICFAQGILSYKIRTNTTNTPNTNNLDSTTDLVTDLVAKAVDKIVGLWDAMRSAGSSIKCLKLKTIILHFRFNYYSSQLHLVKEGNDVRFSVIP